MRTLNNLKRAVTLMVEAVINTKKHKIIYKSVLREAKKVGNNRYILESVDRTKAMW
jgi:hypothetical protein